MLLRLRDFSNTHRDLFASSPVAQEAFAAVNTAIDELTTTDLLKLSASVSARADRKAIARRALTELLMKVSELSRVLRAQGKDVPAFALPASRSDQGLLTAARQFARDAASFEEAFSGYGIGSKVIADATAAFETATRDRGMNRADHTAARTRIHDLLAAAILNVRRLDLIVDSQLADNNAIRAVWKQARRVESARGPRGVRTVDSAPPVTAPAAPDAVGGGTAEAAVKSTTAATPDQSPAPAKVIETPSSEAA